MRLLLDTQALLWWLRDDGQLGKAVRGLIADPDVDVLVSIVSLWEIVVKVRIGKLTADIRDILAEIDANGFELLDILPAHLEILRDLPVHHRDPFDHLLIAQAIGEQAVFISEDRNVRSYPAQVVACSAAKVP